MLRRTAAPGLLDMPSLPEEPPCYWQAQDPSAECRPANACTLLRAPATSHSLPLPEAPLFSQRMKSQRMWVSRCFTYDHGQTKAPDFRRTSGDSGESQTADNRPQAEGVIGVIWYMACLKTEGERAEARTHMGALMSLSTSISNETGNGKA